MLSEMLSALSSEETPSESPPSTSVDPRWRWVCSAECTLRRGPSAALRLKEALVFMGPCEQKHQVELALSPCGT